MIQYFKNIYRVSKALIQGLMVTGSWLFKPAITVQFPDEKLTPPQRFRGTLTFDKETCTACNLCVKACPTKPIKSVRHTHGYEWGMLDRKEMYVKWTRPVTPSAPKPPAPPAPPSPGGQKAA